MLQVKTRGETGTAHCRRLRAEGWVPAVVYGSGKESLALAVERDKLLAAYHKGERIVALGTGQGEEKVLLKEIQFDPLGERLLHVDFYRVAMDKAIEISVPVEYLGHPKGLTAGGTIGVVEVQVTIFCRPDQIPDKVVVKVAELAIGDSIKVSDLPPLSGVAYRDSPDKILYSIHQAKVEEAPASQEPTAVEPEVITAKKEAPETEEEGGRKEKEKEKEKK